MKNFLSNYHFVLCGAGILFALVLGVITYAGCASQADAQEVAPTLDGNLQAITMPPVVGEVEEVETFDVEVTRWEPKTYIEKRSRRRVVPVFQTERRINQNRGAEWVEDPAPSIVKNNVVTLGETEPQSGASVLSAPRVIKETPFRTIQRNDNFYVDGFLGGNTAATSTAVQMVRPVLSQRRNLTPMRRGLFCRGGSCR